MEKIAKEMRISMGAYCWAHTYFHRGCRGRKEFTESASVMYLMPSVCACVSVCLSTRTETEEMLIRN